MKKLFVRLCIGIVLGIIPSIIILQNNAKIKNYVRTTILTALEKELDAQLSIKKISIHFLSGIILLKAITITRPGCTWHCERGSVTLLKRKSLTSRIATIHLALYNNIIKSTYDNEELGVTKLIKAIFAPGTHSVTAASITITNLDFSLYGTQTANLTLEGTLTMQKNALGTWSGTIATKNGSLSTTSPILKNIQGRGNLSLSDDNKVRAHLNYRCIPAFSPQHELVASCTIVNNIIKTNLSLQGKNGPLITGTNDSTTLHLHNNLPLSLLPGYTIAPGGTLHLSTSKKGRYKVAISSAQAKKPIEIEGTLTLDWPFITAKGRLKGLAYTAVIAANKTPYLKELIIKKKGKQCAKIEGNQQLSGTIDYALLHAFLPLTIRRWLLGNKGTITFTFDPNKKSGSIALLNCKIKIGNSHTVLTNATTDFSLDLPTKKLTLSTLVAQFHKGTITSHAISIEPHFFHASLQANNLLVNWKNDFYGLIDGNFLVKKQDEQPLVIQGDIVIQKSLLKENIFALQSDALTTIPLDFPIKARITLSNKAPILISTPLLQTKANAELELSYSTPHHHITTAPQLTGKITLRKGTLSFPHNKLFISSGTIEFIPTQIGNPIIHLTAKNRIKKYTISLYISGPLKKPTVYLESNPELTDAQIISLLFAGSETINLQTDLPVILMKNVRRFILGGNKDIPATKSFFEKITKPLKYIQITPPASPINQAEGEYEEPSQSMLISNCMHRYKKTLPCKTISLSNSNITSLIIAI